MNKEERFDTVYQCDIVGNDHLYYIIGITISAGILNIIRQTLILLRDPSLESGEFEVFVRVAGS